MLRSETGTNASKICGIVFNGGGGSAVGLLCEALVRKMVVSEIGVMGYVTGTNIARTFTDERGPMLSNLIYLQ